MENDDYRGTILDLRRYLFWIALAKERFRNNLLFCLEIFESGASHFENRTASIAFLRADRKRRNDAADDLKIDDKTGSYSGNVPKLDNGSSYHHQCMEFLEVFDCNQSFFSEFSPQVVDFFDLGNGGDQFYENYLGSSDKLDFLTCLGVSNSLKLTDLYHTDDQEELAVIFEALSQSHSQRGEYETSLIDAKRAFNINPELYLSTLFDAFLKLDRYNEAFELLRSDDVRQFCDPEEIHELELSLRRER